MLSIERQALIADMALRQGLVKVSDLSRLFCVSEMTIRRDLDVLQQKKLIKKIYGGAVTEPSVDEELLDIPMSVRSKTHLMEKHAIAEQAVRFIQPRDVVILDAGTTTLEIARLLPRTDNLVVITNSIPIAYELYEHAGSAVSLLLMGGQVRENSHSMVGSKAHEFLSDLVASILFLGASGLSINRGILNSNMDESEVKRKMMEHCEKVVLVSDSSKFDQQSYHVVATWDEIDVFITDSQLPQEYREQLEDKGVEIILC